MPSLTWPHENVFAAPYELFSRPSFHNCKLRSRQCVRRYHFPEGAESHLSPETRQLLVACEVVVSQEFAQTTTVQQSVVRDNGRIGLAVRRRQSTNVDPNEMTHAERGGQRVTEGVRCLVRSQGASRRSASPNTSPRVGATQIPYRLPSNTLIGGERKNKESQLDSDGQPDLATASASQPNSRCRLA